MTDHFDEEIAEVRSQIKELTARRRLLGKSLLASDNVKQQLSKAANSSNANIDDESSGLPVDSDPLATTLPSSHDQLSSTDTTQLTNMHRLAFTVTTFPFTDPSPNSQNTLNGRLLGIRFDHCSRIGTFQTPYYILLRRVEANGDEWRIHRHTIPAFVPLPRLEEIYLPLKSDEDPDPSLAVEARDGGWESGMIDSGSMATTQDLHGFVRKVRYELTAWNLRWDAIDHLKEQLELTAPSSRPLESTAGTSSNLEDPSGAAVQDISMTDYPANEPQSEPQSGLYGISSIEPTAFEARQARITWTDGTIGRIKINNRGVIERAVVVGESGRIRGVENLLVDGESRIENLIWKLRFLVGKDPTTS